MYALSHNKRELAEILMVGSNPTGEAVLVVPCGYVYMIELDGKTTQNIEAYLTKKGKEKFPRLSRNNFQKYQHCLIMVLQQLYPQAFMR